MLLNLALIPESDASLVRVSQDIAQYVPLRNVLGVESIAHCTVLQFEWDDEPAAAWKLLRALQGTKLLLRTQQVYIDVKKDGVWLGVTIEKSEQLIQLQQNAIQLLGLTPEAIKNPTQLSYRPHFTTGLLQNTPRQHFDTSAIERKNYSCVLHLGVSGENYSFENILF
jgi:hypothetical protein